MPAAEIATGLGALKSAYEIAKTLKNIDDRVKLNSAVIELQEQILSAQEAGASAKERIQELEAIVASHDQWGETANRYALRDYGGATYAYELKAEEANGEPIHRICPNCFERQSRSILQFRFRDNVGRDHYSCLACKTEFEFGLYREPAPVRQHDDYDPFG